MTIQEKLNANIPAEAVEQRDGGGGKKLSYLSGAYVIDRMNEIIGIGNWNYFIKSLDKVYEGTATQYSGEVFTTSYIARVQLEAHLEPGRYVFFEDVGYGDGSDKKSPGKAHELAVKEAVTDALKRAAKNLGRSMGLGLYFKSGEFVDEQQNTPVKPAPSKEAPKNPTQPSPLAANKDKAAKPQPAADSNTDVSRKIIREGFGVLQALKRTTKAEFLKTYLEGASTVDGASEEVIKSALSKMKVDFPDVIK